MATVTTITRIDSETFRPEIAAGFGEWVDIPATVQDLGGVDFGGSIYLQGASAVAGGFAFLIQLSTQNLCFFEQTSTTTTTPSHSKDPPVPPAQPTVFNPMSANLQMIRLRTFSFDAVATLNGAAQDITGGTLRMTAKWSPYDADGDAVFQKSSPSTGIVITDATAGKFTVTIDPVDTTTLPLHRSDLAYDVQLTDATSHVYSVLQGTLTIFPNITVTTP